MQATLRSEKNKMHVSFLEKYASFILPILLLITDYVSILMAEWFSYGLRKDIIPLAYSNFYIPNLYFYFIVPMIFLAFLHFADTHIRHRSFWKIAEIVFSAVIYSIFTIILLMYFGKVSGMVSRLFVVLLCIFSFTFILAMRYFLKKWLSEKNILQIPVVFIGAGRTAELVLHSFDRDAGFGYRVVGFIDDHPVSTEISKRFKILGGFNDAESIIRLSDIQTVIITAPGLSSEKLVSLINQIQPHVKNVAFIPDIIGVPVGSLEVESLVDEKIMMLKVRNNLARGYNRALKRLFDVIVSLCGIVLISPFMLLLAIFIYIDSPGTIIFSHRRIGKNGKEFPCYKFRSMVPNAEFILKAYLQNHPVARDEWNKDFKLKNDPRITKLGKFLRKTSLDELPQLLNVLKGEMSLVGPRPIVKEEVKKYGEYIYDFYLVPPGITGMWQVNGRSDTTYEERVEMDSWYVRNWSIWIDIVYLLKTIKVVLERKGAY